MKKLEEEKMVVELHVADIIYDNKIKMDAARLQIRKIRRYAIDSEAWFHYAIGFFVTLVAIFIIVIIFRFTR